MASKEDIEMSPQMASHLFENGGALIVLGLPVGSVFGIDMKVNQVGEKFLGVKMIPVGVHFIFWSAVSRDEIVAPRSGFFHYFHHKDTILTKWDKENEELIRVDQSSEDKHRIRDNLQDLDRNLGPYPFEQHKQWERLTSNISESLLKRLMPECGIVRSVTQLIPQPFIMGQKIELDSTSEPRSRNLEDRLLPHMDKEPGTEIRFTQVKSFSNRYPSGSSAAEITSHSLDSTFALEQLLQQYDHPSDILGELQMAHVCFLIGHVYDAFEQWRHLLQLVCTMDEGLNRHQEWLKPFIALLHYQLKDIPEGFFVDLEEENNFLVNVLRRLFENIRMSDAVSEDFKAFADRFRKNLTVTYKWDFEAVPDDELPVIVET